MLALVPNRLFALCGEGRPRTYRLVVQRGAVRLARSQVKPLELWEKKVTKNGIKVGHL